MSLSSRLRGRWVQICEVPYCLTRRHFSERKAYPGVVVVGASVMDMIAYVPRFPTTGETLHGSSFATGFGGKGT